MFKFTTCAFLGILRSITSRLNNGTVFGHAVKGMYHKRETTADPASPTEGERARNEQRIT